MLPRTARNALLSSRQNLPRPARLYSTPTKKANAPALASVQLPRAEYPPYLSSHVEHSQPKPFNDLESYLNRQTSYTILPTPSPHERNSEDVQQRWFTDSATQDLAAVMDACLHNFYDVPRAKGIFERLREDSGVLETRVYNAFLQAYLDMATTKDIDDKHYWVSSAWSLYHVMERGFEKVEPDARTYAIMLLTWYRFNKMPLNSITSIESLPPSQILHHIVDRSISVSHVVADRIFTNSEEAIQVIKILSKAALETNLTKILLELGRVEAIGSRREGTVADAPEVQPVLRSKKDVTPENTNAEQGPEIPFNIDLLRRHLADISLARRVLPDDIGARQKMLEESVYEVAVTRLKEQTERLAELGLGNNKLKRGDLRRWMWQWHIQLRKRLNTEVQSISQAEADLPIGKAHQALSPYLSIVEPDRLSIITILEVMRLQGSGGISDGMKTTRALISVGRAVEMEYKAQMCKSSQIHLPTTSSKFSEANFFSKFGYQNLQERRIAAAKHMSDAEAWTASWSQSVRAKVGGILVDCLMDVAEVKRTAVDPTSNETISEVQPAFYHAYEYQRGQKLGVIRLNPVVAERLADDSVRDTLHPRHLPMLVKPQPWLDYDRGGYLYSPGFAMRFKNSIEQQNYLREASAKGQVELVYAGLDVLGSTPWQINKKIFDVVLKVWNSGNRMVKIPPAVFDMSEPIPLENAEIDLKSRSIFLMRQRAYYHGKANCHSERCSVNYKIEIARAFLNDKIYLPHNLDFRGRAYPIPPHLNQVGDDLCRGLLCFGDAKPLGVRGLRWLKIHLANLYGFDKAPFDDRVEWVAEHMEKIYNSASDPLNQIWWQEAGDPWQFLAACIELHAALESGDPHSYMSSLPVHQDGTCNGLQHYAALGGDAIGAQQVNLASGKRPADVYSHVGRMVEELLGKDVEKGHELAILLKGKISRKVVKQTVMTTVYGVTFVGARDQIERQLKERKDISEELCWSAASYLAKLVLACIGDLFSGANNIQTWLNLCARLISKSIQPSRLDSFSKNTRKKTKYNAKEATDKLRKEQMTSVIWTTPLGLPIVQPYRKSAKKQVMTSVQSVYISDPNAPAEVNSLKQASAFPPNFIHSLDATHMMLTALKCNEQGLTFASVHDSYWTHAGDIDTMSEIIRDTFIALHSSDILGKLQAEFVERYKGYKVPLSALRSGTLAKNLRDAGSRIVTTPEQAHALESISELLTVREADQDESTEVPMEQTKITETPVSEIDTLLSDLSLESGPGEVEKEGNEKKVDARSTERKNTSSDKAAMKLYGKFVDLADLLPPLPKKGSFDVESIKSSQYFFS